MERADAKTVAKHWRWEKDSQDLAWLTFDKQGESTNTFSRDALEELSSRSTISPPQSRAAL
jgi:hypothetical protein